MPPILRNRKVHSRKVLTGPRLPAFHGANYLASLFRHETSAARNTRFFGKPEGLNLTSPRTIKLTFALAIPYKFLPTTTTDLDGPLGLVPVKAVLGAEFSFSFER